MEPFNVVDFNNLNLSWRSTQIIKIIHSSSKCFFTLLPLYGYISTESTSNDTPNISS